ncbi:hypothetical protein DL239_07230 [Sedimentitalea sp. CY04]|uniref:C-type lysozyme inhibitor domain-containing protein n=1 Tax=Parasedimentitalea denitrificans TaxID=2211118 RepID=A0ABX0W8Z5_9RHOB|nr:MliC family protein [Sedimentitalea sp. CY04]NIZ60765.1 hypothetical protein [Sedimentitalea sp. CY04]
MRRCVTGGALMAIACANPLLADTRFQEFSYGCERGATVVATYVNSESLSAVVLLVEGQTVALTAGPTGSGVRYSAGPNDGYVWHTKGDEAVLFWQDAGEQDTIYQSCLTR